MNLSGHTSDIFVGRQQEFAALTDALDDAVSGRGQMVMLAGEPGIGKTRIAQELSSHAESLGALVLWGWCYESEGAPPYRPWVQLLRDYMMRVDTARLHSEMGPGAEDIAEIIPVLRDRLPRAGSFVKVGASASPIPPLRLDRQISVQRRANPTLGSGLGRPALG